MDAILYSKRRRSFGGEIMDKYCARDICGRDLVKPASRSLIMLGNASVILVKGASQVKGLPRVSRLVQNRSSHNLLKTQKRLEASLYSTILMEVADENVDRELVRYGWGRRECIRWLSTHHTAAALILKIFGHVFANSRIDASETRVLTAVECWIDYLLCSSGTKRLRELARKALCESTWIGIPFSITSDRKEAPSPARRNLIEVQSKVQNLRIQCSEESVLHWAWSHQENELYSQAPKPWIDQLRGIVAKLVAGPNDPMTSLRAMHICMEVLKHKFSFSPEDRHCIVTSEIAAKRAVQVFLDAPQLLPYQTWASLQRRNGSEDSTSRTPIQSDTVTSLKVDELFETIRETEKEAFTNIDGWCICMRTAPEDELFKGRLAH